MADTKQNIDKVATGPDDYPGRIWDYLMGKGLSSISTAAFMGNIWQESKYNPAAVNGIGATGICQWLSDRKDALQNLASQQGKAITDLDVQLDYLWSEIDGPEHSAYAEMIQYPDDLSQQTIICCDKFERPGEDEHVHEQRIAAAQEAYQKQGKGIKVENTYSGSSGYSSGSAKASDGGFRYIEHGKTVTIIKLPDNKTFCEPIYPDFITVSDTVPQWVLDMSYQKQAENDSKEK